MALPNNNGKGSIFATAVSKLTIFSMGLSLSVSCTPLTVMVIGFKPNDTSATSTFAPRARLPKLSMASLVNGPAANSQKQTIKALTIIKPARPDQRIHFVMLGS